MATKGIQDIGTPLFFVDFYKTLAQLMGEGATLGRIRFDVNGRCPMEVEVRIVKFDGKTLPRITQPAKGA